MGRWSSPTEPAGTRPGSDERLLKPQIGRLLQAVGLDVSYERAAGDHLYYRNEQGREVEVLDLVGGYGSLLLGHNHPALVKEAQQFFAAGRPLHAQGSLREAGERLAKELSRRAGGGYRAVLANSGAEAVEAALKHALLETGGRTVLALEGAFHGKTLGAVQLTASEAYRRPFGLSGLNVVRVPRNDAESLEAAFVQASDLAGFIFEPIQGEGGVWPLESAFVRRAAELCTARGVPLIADECQAGLGRTGTFLACEALEVRPDYVILSKALGGGLAKIAALLVCRRRYRDAFDLLHTSTYAEDDFSCTLALKALELIDQPLLDRCRELGQRLLTGLRRLQERYPDIIADVRGLGLLLGLEFRPLPGSPSFLLRFLAAQERLVPLLAGYLLRTHQVRVVPTLSHPFTLRLQPSALFGDDSVRQLFTALEDVCARLQANDARALTGFLLESGPPVRTPVLCGAERIFPLADAAFGEQHRRRQAVRVSWLCHFIDTNNFLTLEPKFANLPASRREDFLARAAAIAAPVVTSVVEVRSKRGKAVQLYSILLPVTSRWMKHHLDARCLAGPRNLVEQGVAAARSLGCRCVALGQYTSIVTRNGSLLAADGIGVTTGNSYALALALQALDRAHRERGSDPAESVLAVVGAAGNIGRTCAAMLAPRYRHTLLVGSNRPGSRARLAALAQRLPNATVATDPNALAGADVVVAALNAIDAPLGAVHFASGAVVCDLSVPAGTCADLAAMRPDLLLIRGGTVRLPFAEDLDIPGFPLPPGYTYGCMAEAILLGLEGACDTSFTGPVRPRQVRHIAALARRHGFELADYKRLCVLDSLPAEVIPV